MTFTVHSSCRLMSPSYLKNSYDPNTNEWTTRGQMINARAHMGLAVLENLLYVIGGLSTTGYLELVECYDPVVDAWQAMNPMNVRRANAGVGVLNHEIYVLGGQSNNGEHLQSVEVYNFYTEKWTMVRILTRLVDYCNILTQ